MPLIIPKAESIAALLLALISTIPKPSTSSMLILAPLFSCIPWIILPPGPMIAPINSLATRKVSMRGV